MQQKHYDIFISYRRKDKDGKPTGTNVARTIQQALEARGYKGRVFFDHNQIRSEDFEEKILGAIKHSKIFLCILTKNAMDNCVNETDWVRREICQAIESRLKIIFLNPDNEFNHKQLNDNFPKELEIVKTQNNVEIRSGQKFNVDMDDLVKNHIKIKLDDNDLITKGVVRIFTDLDCRILNYGQEIGKAKVGEYVSISVPLGDNHLEFIGIECIKDSYKKIVTIKENHPIFVEVKLLDKHNTRKRNEYLLSLPDDEFYFRIERGKYGFRLNSTQEVVITPKYDDVCSFVGGLARVKLNGAWGYIDKTGKEVIPIKYDVVNDFNKNLACVGVNNKYGCINKLGSTVIPCKYDKLELIKGGLVKVLLNNKYGLLDIKGNKVTSLMYDVIQEGNNNLLAVKLNNKWGYIDRIGNIVISCKYDIIEFIDQNLVRVKSNDKFGFINKYGKEITPLIYDRVWNFCNDGALVKSDNKYGFINKEGKEITPLKYDDIGLFCEDIVKVKLNDKWGYINRKGEEITAMKYDGVSNFKEGRAIVLLKNKYGFIDQVGSEICPLKYENACSFCEDRAQVKLDGKWGYIGKSGDEIIPPQYDSTSDFSNGKAKVRIGGFFLGDRFYIDKNGSKI